MSKGLLMVAVLDIESEHFKQKDYRLTIKLDNATYTHFVGKGNKSLSLGKNYQLFPLANHLQVRLYEDQQKDTKEGYFKIPMAKLYQLPRKNHVINVRCVWVEKADGKVSNDLSATVKLSVIYDNTSQGNLQIHIKQADLERDTEVVGKMDPYLVCVVGNVQSKTNVLEQGGKNPKWNQKFTYVLQSIPSSINLQILDKDIASDDIVGTIKINPQQEGYFLPSENDIERTVQINHEGQKAGVIKLATKFKLVPVPA